MDVVHAPAPFPPDEARRRGVFLAGTIDQGASADWQADLTSLLATRCPDALVLNPRRPAWDASWRQDRSDPRFVEQVTWELEAMERARVVAFCFRAGSRSPVTLLEFGLYARSGSAVVLVEEGFWRKGNVDVVAARYGAEAVADLPSLADAVARRLGAP